MSSTETNGGAYGAGKDQELQAAAPAGAKTQEVDLKDSAPDVTLRETPDQPSTAVSVIAPEAVKMPSSVSSSASSSFFPPMEAGSDSLASLLSPNVLESDGKIQLLEYKPFAGAEKWVEYRFSGFNKFKAWFAFVLVMIFFACSGPGWVVYNVTNILAHDLVSSGLAAGASGWSGSQAALELFFGFFLSVLAVVASIYLRQPTHVALMENGLGLEWRRGKRLRFVGRRFVWLDDPAGKYLMWNDVERIDLVWPAGKTSPQDCLIIFKDGSAGKKQDLALKLGAIVKEDDRSKLFRAIEKYAPNAQKDVQLLEVLTPAQDHSYTELWLQALSAPPKRERLTPLSELSSLQNDQYTVVRQLGVGGQGTAYLAIDKESGHEIVLKEFILPVYVDTNVLRQALERMQNEAAMLRKLNNERVVRLSNFFVEDHRGYLVLEKIEGESLEQVVSRDGCRDEQTVISLALQMCEILGYLHSLEPPVIHRDFTPDNMIFNVHDGMLKLVDFNVAQQTESTATGTVVGKHSYISPEQFRGRPTPQSDIYAMGATLFYLLTAEAPEPIKVSHPKLKRDEVSDALDAIVARATAFDSKKRYACIEDLRADLLALSATVEGVQTTTTIAASSPATTD
jgi:tRNA A-37 threonylcarbamoyl transferase component Bud32